MMTQGVLAVIAVALIILAIFSALLTGTHVEKKNANETKFGLCVVALFSVLGMAAAFCV